MSELGVLMELLTAPRADDLGALLERINVRSVVYCLSDLGSPWGFRVDGSATAKFHLVLDGQATLTIDDPGATTAVLSAGKLALLPHGSGHVMQDRAGCGWATPPDTCRLRTRRYGRSLTWSVTRTRRRCPKPSGAPSGGRRVNTAASSALPTACRRRSPELRRSSPELRRSSPVEEVTSRALTALRQFVH